MAPLVEPRRVAEIMLSWLGLDLVSCVEIQSLWAGYGHICAVKARSSKSGSGKDKSLPLDTSTELQPPAEDGTIPLVLKLISPPNNGGDEGHLRKILSYEVEQYFYQEVAPQLGERAAVAKALASTRCAAGKPQVEELDGLTATLMTDLRPGFPVMGEKRSTLDERQVGASLDWLACFHGSSWALLPDELDAFLLPPLEEAQRRRRGKTDQKHDDRGHREQGHKLWLNGGYTYLATRRNEYASLQRDVRSEWRTPFCEPFAKDWQLSTAETAASFLTPRGRPFETYIHGDVKSENLFTTRDGERVAFFDFQYAGLGLGVCDLAKLFTCSVPLDMLTSHDAFDIPDRLPMGDGEKNLLKRYRKKLLAERTPGRGPADYEWDVFRRHWETALVDWCRFQASWGFWGNTEWLEARVRWIVRDEDWRSWLNRSVAGMAH